MEPKEELFKLMMIRARLIVVLGILMMICWVMMFVCVFSDSPYSTQYFIAGTVFWIGCQVNNSAYDKYSAEYSED